MKRTACFTCLFTFALLFPAGLLSAAELSGTVLQTAGPYMLLQTESGQRVARTESWTAYGNLVGIGELDAGGETVRVRYSAEVAGVPLAMAVTRETEYSANPDLMISADQLSTGMKSGVLLLIDSRSHREWDEAHLPGAAQALAASEVKQPAEGEIVIYGSSSADLRPFESARLLSSKGFTNIRVFAGGVKEWRRQGKPLYTAPAHLALLLAAGRAFRVVDLRQPSPATVPLLVGAEVRPAASLSRSALFLPERSYQLPLFFYGEERDQRAAAGLLAQWGYHNDADFSLLDPSWREWVGRYQEAKLQLGELPPGEIGYAEFRALWTTAESKRAVLLNVKPRRDRADSGEIHIPMEELPERLGELPRDREIIIYCSVGRRSAVAQRILQMNGFSSRFLNRTLQLDADKHPRTDLQ